MLANRKKRAGRPKLPEVEKARRAAKRAWGRVEDLRLEAEDNELPKQPPRVGRPSVTAQMLYERAVRDYERKFALMRLEEDRAGESHTDPAQVDDPYEHSDAGRPRALWADISEMDRQVRVLQRRIEAIEREGDKKWQPGDLGRPVKRADEKIAPLRAKIAEIEREVVIFEAGLGVVDRARRQLDRLRIARRAITGKIKVAKLANNPGDLPLLYVQLKRKDIEIGQQERKQERIIELTELAESHTATLDEIDELRALSR